jgi:hypothetical protein
MQPAGPFGASVAAPQAGGDGGGVRVDGGAQGAERWDVNLWLVRTLPGKPAESTHSVLKMGRDGASFTFAPIRVSTGRGDATVQVSGSLAIVRGSSGEDELVFKTSRRTSTASDGQPTSDRGLDSTGTSRVAFRMPAPGEVLAFEMPPLFIQGELVASDIFSVRLSVAPRR